MARGGGTGSRGKGTKKAPTKTESQKPEGLKTTNNGPTEDGDGRQQKNNKNRNRHKKDGDAPSNNHTEDVNREEKKEVPAKLQPTSEQLRLAQITQTSDLQLDPQHRAKISQVMDITGKTEDEVGTALFDCGWDETKAIELLIEEGGLGSWEETGKKKKKKEKADNNKENFQEDWDADNDNFDPNQHNNKWEDDSRERSRNRGPPRLRRGGGQSGGDRGGGNRGGGDRWAPGGERSQPPKAENWDNNEWSEWKDNENEGGGGRGRGGRGMGPRSGRGREDLPPRQRGGGRGAGGRQFGNREFGSGPRGSAAPDSGGFGAIETWNPVGEERRGARHSNKDAFDNAGNWGDDFPAAEDWDNDEYTGSLSDTKVFTASSGATQAAVGQPVNGTSPAPAPAAPAPVPVPTPANNSFTNSNYSQPIDLSALLKSPGVSGSSAAPGGPTASLGQFNPQTATQDLKSAIGIGGSSAPGGPPKDYSSASLSYSSGGGSANTYAAPLSTNNSQAFTGSGSAFSPIKPAAVTNGSPTGKALPRARLPPPSKIPSSAVEMPGDSLSNLDVQFGGLDLQFGTGNGESGSSAGTGFEFGGGSGSSLPPPKDIDNKAKYPSIPTSISPDKSLDGYKSVPSVKDVSTSLTSALSAAGINPSSPSDSAPGYVSAPRSDKPAAHAVGYGSAPQTIQDQRNKNNASDNSLSGYNSSSYSYQSAGQQPVKPSSQYGQSNSAGYANSNSYERSNSNSYQNSGASLGPAGYPVSTNSYNNSSAGTNSYTAANSPYSVPVQSSTNNYNSGYSSVATTYPSYGGTNSSSYSSKSNNQSSQNSQYAPTTTSNQLSNSQLSSSQLNNSQLSNSQLSNSQLSNSQLSNSQLSNSQLSNSQLSNNQLSSSYPSATDTTTSTAASLTTPNKYEATTTVSAGGYTAVNSTGVAGLLSGTGISSSGGSSTKMSVSSGNGKMGVPNLPPGVASMLPAQYMIGANAAAGFPAYLAAAGLQQPAAMYGYGGVGGVGGHGLEDLAALQRSTLAASLPQLVSGGASGHGGAAPQPGVNKGPSTAGYYDPSSQFAASNSLSSRQDPSSTFANDSKFGAGGVTDSTSSPVPSTAAPAVQQPQPFNALAAASGFATAAPQQHPTLPPGYAYFYGGMAGPASLQAAYGGVGATGVYPTAHPGLQAVPTAAGNTATTQFQNKAYGSRYGSSGYTSYDTLGQNNSEYGKSNYGTQGSQPAKSGSNSNSAGHHYWSNALW